MDAGAVQDTTDCAFAFELAVTDVGAPGAAAGTAASEATDTSPAPVEFVPVTVNV
ncbi:unannotated protein [freshwater metagenome]|uniref:Unannotated protein n=1 Tax=freshwater metagenome TaxID=449393 RepID=A0A6J7K5N8_9ZZZZ